MDRDLNDKHFDFRFSTFSINDIYYGSKCQNNYVAYSFNCLVMHIDGQIVYVSLK